MTRAGDFARDWNACDSALHRAIVLRVWFERWRHLSRFRWDDNDEVRGGFLASLEAFMPKAAAS